MDARKVMETEPGRRLALALAQLPGPDEAAALLSDLCTPKELLDLSQRLEVARLLEAREPYLVVQQRTGASSTTVSRVSKCLNGSVGGYRAALERLAEAGGEGPAAK